MQRNNVRGFFFFFKSPSHANEGTLGLFGLPSFAAKFLKKLDRRCSIGNLACQVLFFEKLDRKLDKLSSFFGSDLSSFLSSFTRFCQVLNYSDWLVCKRYVSVHLF